MRPRKPMTKMFNFIYVFSVVDCRSCITFHVGSHGLNKTTESVSAVSMRPRDWFPRSHWDLGIGSRGLNDTAEIWWHCGNPYKNEFWFSFPLIGNHRKHQYICKHCIPIVTRKRQYWRGTLTKNVSFRNLIETAESDFGDSRIGDYKAICKTALDRESGA
jgi:hypothetical protein